MYFLQLLSYLICRLANCRPNMYDPRRRGWITSPLRIAKAYQGGDETKSCIGAFGCLCELQTGSGKTLCYAVLPFAFDLLLHRIVLVILLILSYSIHGDKPLSSVRCITVIGSDRPIIAYQPTHFPTFGITLLLFCLAL